MASRTKRQKANQRGHGAERYAAFYLRLCGYSLLQTRFKTHAGEVDLIAKKNNILVLVEVKHRKTLNAAIDSVTPSARKRIARAGGVFLSRNPALGNLGLRYDIIAISGLQLQHLRDAWRDN